MLIKQWQKIKACCERSFNMRFNAITKCSVDVKSTCE